MAYKTSTTLFLVINRTLAQFAMIVHVFDDFFGIVRSISITQNVLCTSLQGCENGSVGQLPKNSDDTLPTDTSTHYC